MSDRLVATAVTYTTRNKHKRRKFMPSAGCEHTIPRFQQWSGCRPAPYNARLS